MTTTGNTTSFLPSLNDGEEGGGILAVLGISRTVPLMVGIALIFTFLLNAILTPRLDPREPPLAKPTIPLVGHIIDLMRYQANFHPLLSRRRFRDKQPIVTLQMLTGKMYAVWDPRLVSSSYKSKTLSTNPQIRAVISPLCQVSPETRAKLSDAKSDEMTNYMLQHVIPAALSGQGLAQMNLIAMAELCSSFHSTVGRFLGEGTEIKNFYLWTRRELCLATSKALYGDASVDPFRVHPEMEQALFDFESSIFKLALNLPLPWLVAPKGHRARQILQDGLRDYYLNKLHDGDRAGASEFVRVRAKTLRDDGILERDIPKLEIMLPFAAMSNTVPTMFWFLVFIFASPQERKERLRQEILDGLVTERTEGQVTFRMGQSLIEEKCPLLFACYRETLRITIHQVATRTVTEDTVLTGSDGREYLLKKDVVLQMAGSNGHKMEAWWGEDAETYRPERWLEQEYQRSSRAAYQPFGGGIHLCPGRFFAFAEMTTAVVMFLLGYDVEPLGGGQEWKLPKFRTGSLVDAVSKPMDEGKGFGISVRPKKGWEGVKFKAELA